MRIGFIGLGQMGRGMAARLLERGYDLSVWNRRPAACDALRQLGAQVASRPQALLEADVVITMLADDAAVEAVWIASGMVLAAPSSSIHLNMASVSLGMARRLAALHRESGSHYVSAPVFGRPPSAANGQLDIIAAGEEAALTRCAPLFEALGRRFASGDRVRFLGMIGSRTKQALLWKHLREAGIGDEFLQTVRTPMGAYLGGRSHEEIAVSVVAELIAVRRLGHDLAATWDGRKRPKGRVEGVRHPPAADAAG